MRDALATVFETNPRLRSYVIGDQGHLRPNVVVFIDGRRSALALVSDNNFGAAQFTQFVALAVTVPIPEPTTALLWAAGALVLVARVRTQRQSPSM